MLRSLQDLEKCTAGAAGGDIGRVKDFCFGNRAWVIRYLIVDTGNWWLGHRVLVAPQRIGSVDWLDRTLTVDLSREAAKAAPPYDPSADLDQQCETALCTRYGRLPHEKAGTTP